MFKIRDDMSLETDAITVSTDLTVYLTNVVVISSEKVLCVRQLRELAKV
jgi:hypothetical protein